MLVLSVAVDYSVRWWIYHAIDIVYEFKDELRLAAARGSHHQGGEGIFKREHDLLSVSLDVFEIVRL